MENRLYKQDVVKCPLKVVYDLYSKGFGDEYLYNSSLSDSRILKREKIKGVLGNIRKCWLKNSKYFLVEKISKAMRNKIIVTSLNTNLPVKNYNKIISFNSLEENVTEVNYCIEYDLKFSLLDYLLKRESPVSFLSHKYVLKDLKGYLEKGHSVNNKKVDIVYF